MISIFDSSDLGSDLADTIAWSIARGVPRNMARTHGGLNVGPSPLTSQVETSFEHRLKCGSYPWTDYTQNPTMIYNVWDLVQASENRKMSTYMIIRRLWDGKLYNAKQAIRIGTNAMWRRVGVKRRMPLSSRGVCTEVVWCYLDLLGGSYQRVLHTAPFRSRDGFDPMIQNAMCRRHPELFRRKPHVAGCRCLSCGGGG